MIREARKRSGEKVLNPDVVVMGSTPMLCCPEDQECELDCVSSKLLCRECKIPVCRDCRLAMQANRISTVGLIYDNFNGYLEAWGLRE